MKILHLSNIHFGRNYARTKITDPFGKRDEYDEAYNSKQVLQNNGHGLIGVCKYFSYEEK